MQAVHFAMLLAGECLEGNIGTVSARFGYCRQRYYQVLEQYKAGGMAALTPKKRGPQCNYRRTDEVVRQVLRYRFLDPESSAEVIGQKLRQRHLAISDRSVARIIADYGIQKKTPYSQSQKSAAARAYAALRPTRRPQTRRRAKPGTGRAAAPGR